MFLLSSFNMSQEISCNRICVVKIHDTCMQVHCQTCSITTPVSILLLYTYILYEIMYKHKYTNDRFIFYFSLIALLLYSTMVDFQLSIHVGQQCKVAQ